jgi:hypothetical protein
MSEEKKTLTNEEKSALFREDIEWLLKDLPSEEKPKKGQKKIVRDRMGRPSVMTQEVVLKLKAAFLIRCTVEEACQSAGINRDTYYKFLKRVPDFSDTVQGWRDDMVRIARRNIRKTVANGDHSASMEFLRTARKDEFAPKSIQATGNEVTADDLDRAARGDIEVVDEDEE